MDKVTIWGLLILASACTPPRGDGPLPPATEAATETATDSTTNDSGRPWTKRVLASQLANPRGLIVLDANTVLVAEAGDGDPQHRNSGRLLRLRDSDGDGVFEQRTVVLDDQPSVNIVERLDVHRDEVFGFADLERGDAMILATVADPTEGSVVWRVDQRPRIHGQTAGNANSIAWHPGLKRWFAVQSFANTVIDLADGRVVAAFADLDQGQQAVPSALVYEPATDALLVALFSGQRGGDTNGTGVDFVHNSGQIVRLDPRTGGQQTVAVDLNAPTDVALWPDGRLLVLEFCDAFVGPVEDLKAARTSAEHGGFARFSGRLLQLDLQTSQRVVVASGLDLPTHVLVDGDRVLLTEGQGTPGRSVPGPNGPIALDGRVLELRRAPP